MADPTLRLASNAPGQFYVDDSCIDCDLCREHAPAFFSRDDTIGLSRVYRQPQSPGEVALAQEALENCPVEAIGRDLTQPAPRSAQAADSAPTPAA